MVMWKLHIKFLSILANPSSKSYGFSSGHVWMWELDCEESWAPNNWCFWTVVLEKTPQLEKTLLWTARRSNQSILKEISPGCSLQGLTDIEAETPSHFPPHTIPQGLFKWVSSSHQVAKVLEFQLQYQSVLAMNTQDWSPLGWTGWISLQSKGLSRVFSNTTV